MASLNTTERTLLEAARHSILCQPHRVHERWLGKYSVLAAWVGLLVAVVSPPEGLGVVLCWLEGATGLPCPGCGLTRSLSCAIRGLLIESWSYHPMGPAILVLFILTAAYSLFPRLIRDRFAQCLQDHATSVNVGYCVFVLLFVGFGLARAVRQAAMTFLSAA